MNKYINTFASSGDYETYKASSAFTTPNVAYLEDNKEVVYEQKVEKDWSKEYLTFLALEDGTFTFSTNSISIKYSLDDGETWTELAAGTPTPTVTAGNKIMFKGHAMISTTSGIGTFSSTGNYEAMGNPYSLRHLDAFDRKLVSDTNEFRRLFRGSTGLVSAEHLGLPNIQLAATCYHSMFVGCTSLTTAPALPATTLAHDCYSGMFSGCTSLTTAPELPATTLDVACYFNMFQGCTSLTTAPVIPATTLAERCYKNMFKGCTSLNYIKMLATSVTATDCLLDWVNGVSSTGTFVKHPDADLPSGTSGIPEGWTVETATT